MCLGLGCPGGQRWTHRALTSGAAAQERTPAQEEEEDSSNWRLSLPDPGHVTWSCAAWWGGRPYLQGLGQAHEVPLHLLAGLQLGLQPQQLCPLLREEVCELSLGDRTRLEPWARRERVAHGRVPLHQP